MTNLASGSAIAEVASLIGDTARANILSALMDGRALTAGELAFHSGVSAQTASGHLAKLLDAQLVVVAKQGRHRYYRLASAEIAEAMEALMALAAVGPRRHRPVGPRDDALRLARTCYDHLAGRLGIALADALATRGHIILAEGAAAITPAGDRFLRDFGIELTGSAGRPLCRACLDWSERRWHLAGRLGAALCRCCFDLTWIERREDGRAVSITPAGRQGLAATFGIVLS